MNRFVGYGLSIAAALSLGTSLVLLRGPEAENIVVPEPRVIKVSGVAMEVPLTTSPSASQFDLISVDAGSIEEIFSTRPPIAQAAPFEQRTPIVDPLIEPLLDVEPPPMITAQEPPLDKVENTAQLNQRIRVLNPLIVLSPDVGPPAQLAAPALHPEEVELEKGILQDLSSIAQAESPPVDKIISEPNAQSARVFSATLAIDVSLGEISIKSPPDAGHLRQPTPPALDPRSDLVAIETARPTLSAEPRVASRSHKDSASIQGRHTPVRTVARVANESAFVSAASKLPGTEPRQPRHIQRSLPLAFVSLPSASSQGVRSGNGSGNRKMVREQITRIELPHALRPLP